MRFLRNNGLTIVLMGAFAFSVLGMVLAGESVLNEDLRMHGQPTVGLLGYLSSGEFISALFENWESEFLQMAAYVVLTASLFQKGSAESRDPEDPERENDSLPPSRRQSSPVARWLYAHSLGLALAAFFVASFALHWYGSCRAANAAAAHHGQELKSAIQYLAEPQLWFESFQNWQSEFLSTAVLVVLSIFLRYEGSPESKPLGAKNSDTGAS